MGMLLESITFYTDNVHFFVRVSKWGDYQTPAPANQMLHTILDQLQWSHLDSFLTHILFLVTQQNFWAVTMYNGIKIVWYYLFRRYLVGKNKVADKISKVIGNVNTWTDYSHIYT
jgi:hypothetical protein